ncbi:hypothetical protein CDD83_5948 [Cordyceps sp. RAO-2017]|nr:hypothetical protein CDD83_5948 [Cordyceps sp. RAO-2017]
MGSELGVTADSKPEPVLNTVSIFWASLACVWTALLVAGMAYLVSRRNTPMLRIRGLSLSLAAIVLLHLYWISVQLGTMIGPLAPGDAEFWIMGIYLPFGIALFHASNSRFLHIAEAQKKYLHGSHRSDGVAARSRSKRGVFARFRRLDYTSKILIVVGMGMLFQLFLTILMYLISRKFHRSFGIRGTEIHGTEMQQKMQMGRGWEWWPSVFWQFFWAWIVAPIILWRSRGINDTQGWRFQTIACSIVNLHAAPMWLIALYVPEMDVVNQYWIPPQWIAVSIMLTEVFTVFLPCWEVMRHQTLRQETLDSIAQWESKNKAFASGAKSLNSATTMVESMMSGFKSTNGSVRTNDSGESILTMSALEHVLERNPGPLQQFSALRDFSGENIAFLTSVADWKNSLPPGVRDSTSVQSDKQNKQLLHERFNRALHIYAEFISTRDAEFPINISSQDLKKLEGVFEKSARSLFGDKRDVDPATPFDTPAFASRPPMTPTSSSFSSEKGIMSPGSQACGAAEDRAQYWGEVPENFDVAVFDDAEKSIKYLVLTNTWPKFVKDRRSSVDGFESLEAQSDAVMGARNRQVN